MQARAVAAVRRQDARVEADHGAGAVWVAVSHGDIIKSVLADALGMHLDLFQRLHVDPASVSIIRYTATRPFVLATNTHDGDLSWLVPPRRSRARKRPGDAAVGGGSLGGGRRADRPPHGLRRRLRRGPHGSRRQGRLLGGHRQRQHAAAMRDSQP